MKPKRVTWALPGLVLERKAFVLDREMLKVSPSCTNFGLVISTASRGSHVVSRTLSLEFVWALRDVCKPAQIHAKGRNPEACPAGRAS
jgi:hypothetical protein